MTTASSADNPTRRDFLYVATGAAATVGGLAALWPFIHQMNPDASTIAAGAPIEVDLTPIGEGQDIKVFWRGKPIYISHRTQKQIDEARSVPVARSHSRTVPPSDAPASVLPSGEKAMENTWGQSLPGGLSAPFVWRHPRV